MITTGRALVVGAGAIGGPVVIALAAAGRKFGLNAIRVCDDDVVDHSNLQRQVQFTVADVGTSKVRALAHRCRDRGVKIEPVEERFEEGTADTLFDDVDLVVDGSDNFETKFLVSDRAVACGIPAVIGSAIRDHGQLVIAHPGAACYRCLFEEPPTTDRGGCAQIGVLAPVPGRVAGYTASAAIALLQGRAPGFNLAIVPAPPGEIRTRTFDARPSCVSCSTNQRSTLATAKPAVPKHALQK